MASDDREPPYEPEVWISDGSSLPEGGPMGSAGGPESGRRWMRWIAIAVGFVMLVAIIGVQHYLGGGNDATPAPTSSVSLAPTSSSLPSSTATTPSSTSDDTDRVTSSKSAPATAPQTTTVAAAPLPDSTGWELVGFQWSDGADSSPSSVTRYQPATGELSTTSVPPLTSNAPVTFAAAGTTAIIRSMDSVGGYSVVDGQPAAALTGQLATSFAVYPGPDPLHVWGVVPGGDRPALSLISVNGSSAGPTIPLPTAQGDVITLAADGAGYVLAQGDAATYDMQPGGPKLVTRGKVLATGPTTFVVYECDKAKHCSVTSIDRASGKRTPVLNFVPQQAGHMLGVSSADGRYAALFKFGANGLTLALLNLVTGEEATQDMAFPARFSNVSTGTAVFTPDSKYLLVAGRNGVVPIDVATGQIIGRLPIPPQNMIAIRGLSSSRTVSDVRESGGPVLPSSVALIRRTHGRGAGAGAADRPDGRRRDDRVAGLGGRVGRHLGAAAGQDDVAGDPGDRRGPRRGRGHVEQAGRGGRDQAQNPAPPRIMKSPERSCYFRLTSLARAIFREFNVQRL